ncbi:MAG: hypothetical protein ACKPKO_41890, partial [Candidatus Fonsibacter sp.]
QICKLLCIRKLLFSAANINTSSTLKFINRVTTKIPRHTSAKMDLLHSVGFLYKQPVMHWV